MTIPLFTPKIRTYRLATHVLVVARTRIEGSWKAYVGCTPGLDLSAETAYVLANGTAVPEPVARAMFDEFKDMPYAR